MQFAIKQVSVYVQSGGKFASAAVTVKIAILDLLIVQIGLNFSQSQCVLFDCNSN